MSCIPIQDFSLISLCDATKAGKLYSIVPDTGAGDFDVVRATTATYLGSDGLLKTAANNEPRIEFNEDGSYKGLLVEPAATNLVLRSEEFDSTYWTKQNGAITANTQVAPDGTTTADTLTSDGGDASADKSCVRRTTVIPTDGVFSRSVFMKRGNVRYGWISLLSANFTNANVFIFDFDDEEITFTNNSSGVNIDLKVEKYSNGWFRFIYVADSLTTGITAGFSFGMTNSPTSVSDHNNGDTIHIWGAQVEEGSVATSYIPTLASTVTRAADVVGKTGISSLIGQTEGTLYAEFQVPIIQSDVRLLFLSDDTINNRLDVRLRTGPNRLFFLVSSGGVVQQATELPISANQIIKAALTYINNKISITINGVYVENTSTLDVPLNLSRIDIANRLSSDTLNAHIKAVAILPTAISEQQAINLTS